jgi:cyclase
MLRTRVMPVLLLQNDSLVKGRKFTAYSYVGDPCNTVRIFNELGVDELVFLDTSASSKKSGINFSLLKDIANECFMPLAYGGGVGTIEQARKIYSLGFEKVVLNTSALIRPQLIREISREFGSQAVVVSIDVKRGWLGVPTVRASRGRSDTGREPVIWACEVERLGAGEILLTSINLEGTWTGFDLDLVRRVSDAVSIPVIAHGGAGSTQHIRQVVMQGKASAVALGSMVVFQKQGMGVLVHFPDPKELEAALK